MDTVTQGLLGAVCAEVACGRSLGRRALGWGAVAGMLPDLDMTLSLLGPLAEWQYHRSLTHALWFGPVVGTVLGWAVAARERRRARRQTPAGVWPWIALFVLALTTHPLLDLFTTYGTQLLWPFSRHRFAFDAVAIVDLGYTAVLAAAVLIALFAGTTVARGVGAAALAVAAAYLFYGLNLNERATTEARRQLAAAGVRAGQVHAYPTLFQPWLRRVVARSGDDVRVGLISLWRPAPIAWDSFTQQRHPAIEAARRTEEAQVFEWFAMGQTVGWLRQGPDGPVVEIEDLRFSYAERPEHGLWGIRLPVDERGEVTGEVARFNRRPEDLRRALSRLWRATFRPPGSRA